jgi:hypothetical protein
MTPGHDGFRPLSSLLAVRPRQELWGRSAPYSQHTAAMTGVIGNMWITFPQRDFAVRWAPRQPLWVAEPQNADCGRNAIRVESVGGRLVPLRFFFPGPSGAPVYFAESGAYRNNSAVANRSPKAV